jgi:L-iditol 2-dehydrogenase
MNEIPKTMQAVVYRGANDLRLETLPTPEILDDEILVRVAVCGVCPTDIKKIQHATVPPPRVFGHETAGVICRAGRKVRGLNPGDRVALHHHVPCLRCHFCRRSAFAQCAQYKKTGITAGFEPAGGGYAEYVRVMSFALPGVVKIPRRNSFIEGAMLEPVNTVLKAVRRLDVPRRDSVLVAGQGPIGLMFTRLLRLGGARVFATDLIEERLLLAREFGATATALGGAKDLARQVAEFTDGRGFDAAVLAVPSDAALVQAQDLTRGGGRVLLFAHTRRGVATNLDLSTVCVEEKDLLGSYSSDFSLQGEAARLVFSRRMDVRGLVTREFPLRETKSAIDLAASPSAGNLKVVVRVQNL